MRIFLFVILLSLQAHAYQSSVTSGSTGLTWPNSTINLRIDSANNDLSSGTASTIIQQSISEWNSQTSTQIVPTGAALSEVSFKDNFSIYGPGVIGVTELTYTSGGSIQQAKIYLNDENYEFKSTPGLHSTGEVFLGDVVTHELGHLLGLSHSEVLDASMFYASFPGQSTLSEDDKAGVRSKYGSSYGTISGIVRGGNDVGILGVHVVAFSRTSGRAVGVISDQSGNFSIKGLDLNDSYYLYTGPLKNLSALPGQFANVRNDFCPSSYIGGFFDSCGRENEGFPQAITLTNSTPSVNVGNVTIHCSLKTNEAYNLEKIQAASAVFDPVTIFDYGMEPRYEKAFVGNFLTKNSMAWSKFDELVIDLRDYPGAAFSQKHLRLSFVARQFGNLLEYEMHVKRNGSPVGSYIIGYSGVTQTFNTDMNAYLSLDSLPANNYFEISIRARRLSTVLALSTFAELEQFVTDKSLPYLLISGIESGAGPLFDNASLLSDNSSCLDAPYSYAVSKARSLAGSSEVNQKNIDGPAPLSCGTTGGSSPGDGGSGPAIMAIGFLLAILLSSGRKSAKNFLS